MDTTDKLTQQQQEVSMGHSQYSGTCGKQLCSPKKKNNLKSTSSNTSLKRWLRSEVASMLPWKHFWQGNKKTHDPQLPQAHKSCSPLLWPAFDLWSAFPVFDISSVFSIFLMLPPVPLHVTQACDEGWTVVWWDVTAETHLGSLKASCWLWERKRSQT